MTSLEAINLLIARARANGVASSRVPDGLVLVLSWARLMALAEEAVDSDVAVLFLPDSDAPAKEKN